jgi:mycofactocin precursor peptide peptidase
MRLVDCTWPDVERSRPRVLLVPLGATEQHGPHLPLDTDTRIATALAEAAAAGRKDVAVAPTVPFGSSSEHAGFPGTLSLGQEALEELLVELVRSADDFETVVLASWHGGNAEPLARAAARLTAEERRVRLWRPELQGGDLHAGRTETSLLLAIAPEAVRGDRPRGAAGSLGVLLPALRAGGVRAVSANGVLGDATGASEEEGRELVTTLGADLAACLDATVAVSV